MPEKKKNKTQLIESLTTAIIDNQIDSVRKLLESGSIINEKNRDSCTALHISAREGHNDIIKLLLSKGGDVNATDDDGWTALHYASHNGHTDIIKTLLEEEVDIDFKDVDGNTALYLAADENHTDAIKVLVNKGAFVNAKFGEKRTTVLHISVRRNNLEIINLLLNKRAKVNIKDGRGWFPLHHAAHLGRSEVVKLLLKSGAFVDSKIKNGALTPLHVVTLVRDSNQLTKDHIDIVKLLIAAGADVNAKTSDDDIPLDTNSETIRKLLKKAGAERFSDRVINTGANLVGKAVRGFILGRL